MQVILHGCGASGSDTLHLILCILLQCREIQWSNPFFVNSDGIASSGYCMLTHEHCVQLQSFVKRFKGYQVHQYLRGRMKMQLKLLPLSMCMFNDNDMIQGVSSFSMEDEDKEHSLWLLLYKSTRCYHILGKWQRRLINQISPNPK